MNRTQQPQVATPPQEGESVLVCTSSTTGVELMDAKQDNLTPRQNVAKNGYCLRCKVNGVGKKRAKYGHLICKPCGEERAQAERKQWCVVQPYGKGGYQFITATSAFEVVRQTNQKQIR